MSPLAEEILTDLKGHFEEGASITMLRHWLGEKKEPIQEALAELTCAGVVRFRDNRYLLRRQTARALRVSAILSGLVAETGRTPAGRCVMAVSRSLRLTVGEAKLAVALHHASGALLSYSAIRDALYSDSAMSADRKLIHLYICHIRKRLPVGSVAVTHGLGYFMTDIGLAALSRALPQAVAA